MQMILEKFPGIPAPAGEITIIALDEQSIVDETIWKDLKRVISKEFYNRILSAKSLLQIEFFNKTLCFQVDSIAVSDYRGKFDDLENILKALSLNDVKSFMVTAQSNFKLEIKKEEITDLSINKMQLIGGLDTIINELRDYMHLAFGNTKAMHGIQISRTVLLYGLPGCGKSLLSDALAVESNALVVKINASEIFSKYFGETEANLLSYFDQAFKHYPKPTFMIIEEIVNVCAKETKEDSAKRISSAFLNILDSVHNKREGSRIFLVATTSNIENVNPAVRRCGRLDIEIEIPVPNPIGRQEILTKHLQTITNTMTDADVQWLANMCHGFVGADLANLISKAAVHSINVATAGGNIIEPTLSLADMNYVFPQIKPSAMREVLIECPNVKWTDIGGQDELKLQLKQAIEWPLTNPEKFIRLGINPPRGILMFGPPGCSKTMIAKALATESKVNFLSIKGPELFSMWVGESEKAVRELFRKARQVAPAIIFFDEIDAIGGERSSGGSSSVKERVLAQMLTEMDGVNALQNVTIVAATNRPDLIDKALMRPGRIDRIVYVRLPDTRTREEIFKIKLKKMPIDADVVVADLVAKTDGYSGAEVEAVCQEAALKALEDDFEVDTVKYKDFQRALEIVHPRTSKDLLNLYDDYVKKF